MRQQRKAYALQMAHAPTTSDEMRRDLRALWELTDLQMEKADYYARKFRRQGFAVALLAPGAFWAWQTSHKKNM